MEREEDHVESRPLIEKKLFSKYSFENRDIAYQLYLYRDTACDYVRIVKIMFQEEIPPSYVYKFLHSFLIQCTS